MSTPTGWPDAGQWGGGVSTPTVGLMPDFWVEVFVELQGVLAALTSINRCFPCTRQTVLVENQPSAFTGCIVCKQCLLNMILWTLIQESQTKVLVILQLMIDIFYNN